jgi:hypothetical protein
VKNADSDISPEDQLSETEIVHRREAALKRMLATAPKLHRDSKVRRKLKTKAPKENL